MEQEINPISIPSNYKTIKTNETHCELPRAIKSGPETRRRLPAEGLRAWNCAVNCGQELHQTNKQTTIPAERHYRETGEARNQRNQRNQRKRERERETRTAWHGDAVAAPPELIAAIARARRCPPPSSTTAKHQINKLRRTRPERGG